MLVTDIETKVKLNKFYYFMSNILIFSVFMNDVLPGIINGFKGLKNKIRKTYLEWKGNQVLAEK